MLEYDFNSKIIISGRQGNIYKLEDDFCFKEYSVDSGQKSIYDDFGTKFNHEMFDYFKNNYRETCMGTLYELLYDKNISNVLGYTMKYYQENIDNVLNMPISYIIDNFSMRYELVDRLTYECVRIVDLHYGNIINTYNLSFFYYCVSCDTYSMTTFYGYKSI